MEIKGGNYRVSDDPATAVVTFQGILRLVEVLEYAPIEELLRNVLQAGPMVITLDVTALSFLSSSGISVLTKFAIATRKKGNCRLVVRGSRSVPWHGKYLPDLKNYTPDFELIMID